MNIDVKPFFILNYEKDCLRLQLSGVFKGKDSDVLRHELSKCKDMDFNIIYIDLKDVTDCDLSAINEVIHAHYVFHNLSKKIILLYKKKSVIEKWINTTGINKFIETAIVA